MLVGWPRLEVPIEANVTNDFIGLATCIFDLFSREPDNFVHHIGTETAENNFYIFFFPVPNTSIRFHRCDTAERY